MLYCDNKGALRNAFQPTAPGITPDLKTDHDLIEVAQSLLTLIPITITTQWVKGHYTGNQRDYKHSLNEEVDQIASKYQTFQHLQSTLRKPFASLDYKVRMLYDGSVLTAKA
jgi:hypothetical protein